VKLQVTQENLAKALNTVGRVANSKNTLPILSNVMIKTIGTRLSIAATNLEIAITNFIGSKVSQEGSITVPARLMQDFVSSLPPGVIDLKLEEHKLHIETEEYKSTINGVAADEFPVMPSISKKGTWNLPAKVLKTALSQVIVAAGNDEARPVLTGIYLHTNDGSLYLVATDSYRLAEKKLSKTQDNINLLIPASAMQDLLRILSDHDEDVEIAHDEHQVQFRIGDVELVTRLIEGSYPDYKKLIPKDFGTTIEVSKAELLNITKVSSLFARESAGSVTITADPKNKHVHMKSVASQVGENTASASAKVTGDGEITLNSRYLIDALNAASSDDVIFGFNGKLDPSVLKESGSDDYLHIIMPLKS
jgi:DNA polymerase-3 subunit beta